MKNFLSRIDHLFIFIIALAIWELFRLLAFYLNPQIVLWGIEVFQNIIFPFLALSAGIIFTFLALRIVFPGAARWIKDIINTKEDLTSWQKSIISVVLFCSFLLAYALLASAI